jgi:hypothetical protein
MITQHVVSYGGEVTLTRLPAGRAEGLVWLSFVARGAELSPEDTWSISDHVALMWLDGSTAEVVEEGTSESKTLHVFHLAVRDAGYGRLIINYIEDDQVISSEGVELPTTRAL